MSCPAGKRVFVFELILMGLVVIVDPVSPVLAMYVVNLSIIVCICLIILYIICRVFVYFVLSIVELEN